MIFQTLLWSKGLKQGLYCFQRIKYLAVIILGLNENKHSVTLCNVHTSIFFFFSAFCPIQRSLSHVRHFLSHV